MPTRPSSSASSLSAAAAAASTLRGGRANLFFGMRLLWDDINNIS